MLLNIAIRLDILQVMALVTVVTNASITVFTMGFLDRYSLSTRMIIYATFQWSCIILQVGISMAQN